MKRILFPSEGNPLYPLPADYGTLTREGQRLARINGVRQWLVPLNEFPLADPKLKAEALVGALKLFDLYYLTPDPDQDFDPLFYDEAPLPSPEFHFDIVRQWATTDRNIAIAPRGSAKSFLVRKVSMLRLLSRPAYSIYYATSTSDNAKVTSLSIKTQLQGNQRIHDDWGPEFPDGRLLPRRGEAPFGLDYMVLRNGSTFRAVSAEGKLRGGRPRRFVLDDPEFDPKASTAMSVIRSYMDQLLFKVVLPMIMRPGCGVDWLATFVSRRHYAWHALQTLKNEQGEEVAADSRFSRWSRFVVRAANETPDGKLVSCWPDMWPATDADKALNPALANRPSLEEVEQLIGRPNFMSEYMARPGEAQDAYFGVLTREKHSYEIEGADEAYLDNPRASRAHIIWHQWDGHVAHRKEISVAEFLKAARLFITVDSSYTSTSDSDFKVCTLLAVGPDKGDLFVLDTWGKQGQETELLIAAFKMAQRWKCPSIHVETIKQGIGLYNNFIGIIHGKGSELVGVTHFPAIRKLNLGMMDKTSKIAALSLRFEHGKIKLPLHNRGLKPWSYLIEQIEEFNPEAPDGGLTRDDFLDTVAMSTFVIKGGGRILQTHTELPDTPMDRLARGETLDKNLGIPIAMGVNFHEIPVDILRRLTESQLPQVDPYGTKC